MNVSFPLEYEKIQTIIFVGNKIKMKQQFVMMIRKNKLQLTNINNYINIIEYLKINNPNTYKTYAICSATTL